MCQLSFNSLKFNYFYNPYYGSLDIDVVGPGLRGAFYETIERYERSHGYVITQNDPLGIEVTASKPIFTKKSKKKRKIGDMEIDACSYEQTVPVPFMRIHPNFYLIPCVTENKTGDSLALQETVFAMLLTEPS